MLNFESAQFKRSLAETIAWCATKSLVAIPTDSEPIRDRRAWLNEASQLFLDANVASVSAGSGCKITDTKQWQQARALLERIRGSLGRLQDKLRSAALKPNFDLDTLGSNTPWAEAVTEVVNKRSQLTKTISPDKDFEISKHGRLLLYWPYENLACGAADYSSNGFFDVNNVPPWDIWVDFTSDTLVSWVPSALIEAAQMGIDVNPEGCIRWVD